MRIAYLCCDFGVPVGGAAGSSVHVRETVAALRLIGHEVEVFSPRAQHGDGPGIEPAALDGLAAETARLLVREDLPSHLAREIRSLLYAEHAQRAVLPSLAAFEPHALYERYSLFGYAGAELARDLRLPLVLEVNAPLALEQATHRELRLRRTAEELEGRILRRADAVIAVSSALALHLRRLGVSSHRITVLPNAVDPERFHPRVSGASVRARYRLDGVVIGFAGSLKPWHDLDTLVEAVQLIAARRPDVCLLVVGDGPRRRELADGSRVVAPGAVAHEEMPALLAAMDVVAVPYPEDGAAYFSPLKLFEAMAMGKPVVAARAGQAAELLADAQTGVLYEPGSARDLAAKIDEVLRRPDRGARLGAAARRAVLARHTWERNARTIEALVHRLAPRERVA